MTPSLLTLSAYSASIKIASENLYQNITIFEKTGDEDSLQELSLHLPPHFARPLEFHDHENLKKNP